MKTFLKNRKNKISSRRQNYRESFLSQNLGKSFLIFQDFAETGSSMILNL